QRTRRAVRAQRERGASPKPINGPASAATVADITRATRTACATCAGPCAVVSPETTGTTARAVRLAVRAIALFTPDAMLTWSGSAAAITVAVRGATNVTSPTPRTIEP